MPNPKSKPANKLDDLSRRMGELREEIRKLERE